MSFLLSISLKFIKFGNQTSLFMKFTRLLTLITALLAFSKLYADNDQTRSFNPTPGEITIGASTPIADKVTPTHQSYVDLVECGFNLGLNDGSISYFKEQFKLIGDLNFKYLIQSADLYSDRRKDYIKAFSKDPHFGGWKFKDEPKYDALPELKRQYQAMLKADPDNLIYLNLVGVVEKNFTGPFTKFYDYLEYFQKMFQPEIWSFDYYPILIKNGKIKVVYDTFYSALEDFKTISIKTGRPFWAYCESLAYKTKSYSRPEATEAYLRFEAFSALAYGAQGIIYWTYGQRTSNSVETYLSALENSNGKKTKAWQAAKKVNGEIKKYNDVFYNCKVKDLRHTGDVTYPGTKKLTGEFGPFRTVKSGASGVVVSFIENKGSEYIVIVSRDVLSNQKISLELKPDTNLIDLTQATNNRFSGGQTINFTLNKGGYRIYKIEK